jgi:DNA transformation protein
MTPLNKATNIGPVVASRLNQVGIQSLEELKEAGAENAFIRLREIDPGTCISCLMALEGAIEGIRWHNLAYEKKQELKAFIAMLK